MLLLLFSCEVLSDSLWPHELQPARLLRPWAFPGKNTGVGWPFLLQGIFRMHAFPLFWTPFEFRSPQSTEWGSLRYTVGSPRVPILYVDQQHGYVNPSLPVLPTPRPLGVHIFVFYVCVSISALQIRSSIPFFQIPHICINVYFLTHFPCCPFMTALISLPSPSLPHGHS